MLKGMIFLSNFFISLSVCFMLLLGVVINNAYSSDNSFSPLESLSDKFLSSEDTKTEISKQDDNIEVNFADEKTKIEKDVQKETNKIEDEFMNLDSMLAEDINNNGKDNTEDNDTHEEDAHDIEHDMLEQDLNERFSYEAEILFSGPFSNHPETEEHNAEDETDSKTDTDSADIKTAEDETTEKTEIATETDNKSDADSADIKTAEDETTEKTEIATETDNKSDADSADIKTAEDEKTEKTEIATETDNKSDADETTEETETLAKPTNETKEAAKSNTKIVESDKDKETQATKINNPDTDKKSVKIKTTNTILSDKATSGANLDIKKGTIANVLNQKATIPGNSPLLKIKARPKPIQNPYLIAGASFYNNASYQTPNNHIAEPIFVEEYFQLLFASIKSENVNGVNAVIDKIGLNYDIFIDNFSPLSFALNQNNNPYIMRQLLSLGYDPNTIDLNLKPALYYAVEMQKYDFAIELLLWGANPNFSHKDDITPYDLAMHNNDTIMLDIFSKALAN